MLYGLREIKESQVKLRWVMLVKYIRDRVQRQLGADNARLCCRTKLCTSGWSSASISLYDENKVWVNCWKAMTNHNAVNKLKWIGSRAF